MIIKPQDLWSSVNMGPKGCAFVSTVSTAFNFANQKVFDLTYYRRTSLYAIDTSQTNLAYNEFAHNESNVKLKRGICPIFGAKKSIPSIHALVFKIESSVY